MTFRFSRLLSALTALTVALGLSVSLSGASAAPAAEHHGWLAGRGIADITGEAQGVGMMGYADFSQITDGISTRQHARAFVLVDRASGRRLVHVTADLGMVFGNIHDAVLAKLRQRYGDRYNDRNVMLTATHTHAGVAGFSHDDMYNLMALGAHDATTHAIVDGIVSSIERATDDLAPATLSMGQSHVTNANANRSQQAFDLDPAADRAHFPGARDTLDTALSVRRHGKLVGVIDWFPVHGTSMPTTNHLISADNKGYAEEHWEHDVRGVDDVTDAGDPAFVSSFPQTNAGDMSPNLGLAPTHGPTDDAFDNTRIIGTRQYDGARRAIAAPQSDVTGLDYRTIYVDMADQRVSGRFTPDGKPHRTCPAVLGAAFAAGSTEDGGGGLPVVKEGQNGGLNPAFGAGSSALEALSPSLKDCQSPKEMVIPAGALDQVQHTLPVQLVRLGDYYFVGVGQEVTIVAGLRLREAVAKVTGAPLDHVLVQGYDNAYAHYLTTPEEYDSQQYEGASTVFGRYELPAYEQAVTRLARAMKAGRQLPLGPHSSDSVMPTVSGVPLKLPVDTPAPGTQYGDVLTAPKASYSPGTTVTTAFSAASPDNDLHDGGTFLRVERRTASGWRTVADDGDFSTTITWSPEKAVGLKATITWAIPHEAPAGSYRIRYFGDAHGTALGLSGVGGLTPISGTSPTFTVG